MTKKIILDEWAFHRVAPLTPDIKPDIAPGGTFILVSFPPRKSSWWKAFKKLKKEKQNKLREG